MIINTHDFRNKMYASIDDNDACVCVAHKKPRCISIKWNSKISVMQSALRDAHREAREYINDQQ